MSLALDLLAQAQHLAYVDNTRPRQANLRRSISAAYYALFHLWLAESATRTAPRTPALLVARISRSFSHGEMKEVCLQVVRLNPGPVFLELIPKGFSPELRRAAKAFIDLQTARHLADYDIAAAFTRLEADELLRQARGAFDDWAAIRATDEANVFLSALVFAKRWAR